MRDRTLQNINGERERQDELWGEQNHSPFVWLAILGEEYGEACKAIIENNNCDYRKELVEIAAVAVAAIESLDRDVEAKDE